MASYKEKGTVPFSLFLSITFSAQCPENSLVSAKAPVAAPPNAIMQAKIITPTPPLAFLSSSYTFYMQTKMIPLSTLDILISSSVKPDLE